MTWILSFQRGRRAQLAKLLADNGNVRRKSDAANFAQFDSTDDGVMDVDLMFVSEEVFDQLARGAMEAKLESVRVHMVSLLHLIALKCHAFQHSKSLRRLKDMDDLIQLILITGWT